MNFLKELVMIQHEKTLHQVSEILLTDEFERILFVDKYKKRNYCLLILSNRPTKESRVKIDDLLSRLPM
jgi:hypothetical protein